MRIERHLDALARRAIQDALGVEAEPALRPTQDPKHGDYQINGLLGLKAKLGKAPREIAAPVAARMLEEAEIAAAEIAGPGFVNLRLSPAFVSQALARDLDDARTGVPAAEPKERVVVDFSSPNIAKRMHVGHLRSTILGDALVRILRTAGHEVIADNHLGDWGTQFGLLIAGMREWGDEAALDREPIDELERVYRLASERAKTDEAFAEQARAELAKLQAGDATNRALWERFVAATRRSLDAVYATLGVSFDLWLGESAYHGACAGVVDLLVSKGIARESEGAIGVFFKELDDAPKDLRATKEPFLVRKRDGAFMYATTDVATAFYRRDELHADRALYVVDMRQALHFKQLFAVAKMLGIETRLEHVAFGSVLGEDGKPLKTRDGKAVTLESLLDEAATRASARIQEEGLDLGPDEAPAVARAVGIGAVKYADLRQNRASDYTFDWDKMISFKGNAGPYLQYAYARIRSILRKAEVDMDAVRGAPALDTPAADALCRVLLRYGEVVHAAAEASLPHLLCDHLYAVARGFSAFYEQCHVLRAEGDERTARLATCALAGRQLRDGLTMLGIDVIERM